MADFGKTLIFVGATLLLIGVLYLVLGRTSIPIGRLPGDIFYRGKQTAFYFPLTTSILFSVVISGILYVVSKRRQ
jgi:hypothetical protein